MDPAYRIIIASILLYNDQDTLAIGLILLGLGLDGFVNLRLLGSDIPADEFYLMVLEKGRDIGFRIVYSMIVVLIIVHYAYQPLFTVFVFIILLMLQLHLVRSFLLIKIRLKNKNYIKSKYENLVLRSFFIVRLTRST